MATRQPIADAESEPAAMRGQATHIPHIKTAGEKKFNWETYGWVGYAANVALSLGAVYWAERSKMGQGLLRGMGDMVEKTGLSRKWAEYLAQKSFFLVGGFAVVPVMKKLEDHKTEIVKKHNREIYGDRADTDPVIMQSERELEVAPKQGWKSVISGRLLALLPFYLTVGLLWSKDSPLAKVTKGEWFFDRPISVVSRDVGLLLSSRGQQLPAEGGFWRSLYRLPFQATGWAAKLVPGTEKAAVATQEMLALKAAHPHSIQSVKVPGCDPMHSTGPYYFISEAITSAMVAIGIYLITRLTGPFFDKKDHTAEQADLPRAAAPTEMPAMAKQKPARADTAPLPKIMHAQREQSAPPLGDLAHAR